MNTNPDFMSVTQAAKKLNLTSQRISTFCRQGRLKGATKVGRYWIIPVESVKTFVRQPHGIKKKTYTSEENKKFIENILKENGK